jgi:hypothetical protein
MEEDIETIDSDAYRLMQVVNRILRDKDVTTVLTKKQYNDLLEATANVEAWFENTDPRSMGWVDQYGRP